MTRPRSVRGLLAVSVAVAGIRAAVLLLVLVAPLTGILTGCGEGGTGERRRSELDPAQIEIPRPDLSQFEPAVERQVEELQRRVDDLRRAEPADPLRLAEALGELGNQLHSFLFLDAAASCYAQAAAIDPEDGRWPYYLGVTQGHRGHDAEAVETFERARDLAPDDLAVHIRLGDLHLKLGRPQDARASFRRATELDPQSAAAWFGLARAAVLAGDDAEAVEHFERALDRAPEATAIHYPLAQAYRRLGDRESAQRHLTQHGRTGPDGESGAGVSGGPTGLSFPDPRMQRVLLREVDTAIDTLRSLAAQPERVSTEELVQIARGQIGEKGGAVERFRHRVETEGPGAGTPAHRARVHFVLGRLLGTTGPPEAAARHLGEALRLDPTLETGEIRLRLAEALLGQGNRAGAEAELRHAVQLELSDSDRALAWHRLGELARLRDAGREAIERYERALALDPELTDARLGRATALGRLGRYDEAVAEFRRVQTREPARIEARLGEATALVLTGRLAAARDRLEAALAAVPDSAALARTLAQILASAPDPAVRDGARALELARRVMEAEPDAAGAETLAMALAQSGRTEEAARVQEELLRRIESQTGPGDRNAAGRAATVARLRANLERYRAGRPCCAG